MAEDKPTTPEQQLLKLIEGQGKPGQPGVASAPAGGPKTKSRGFAPGRLLAFLAFWKRRQAPKRPRARRAFSFGIAEVNKALIVAALFLTVYVVFDAVAAARNLQKPPDFAPMKELPRKAVKEAVAPLAETSYYLQKVSSRDIFKEGRVEEAPEPAAPAAPVVEETAEAVQNLALVGISWSSNPDAIIEDKSKQRTYFVKRGQEVGDGVKVEAIFKEHVVVTYEDREYELR